MLVERGMRKINGGDHQDATRRAVWMANYQRGGLRNLRKKIGKKK